MGLIDDLRAQYPWPAAVAGHGALLARTWSFHFAAPPERVWPIVADTSRVNRAIGLSRMDFEEHDGRLEGSTKNAGVVQRWVELPWDWVEQRALMGMRVYSEGFARAVRALYALEPAEGGSRLTVQFEWLPRSLGARLFLALGAIWLHRRYAAVLDGVGRELATTAIPTFRAEAPALTPEAKARLASLVTEIARHAPRAIVDKLAEHVERGDDMDLFRVRPRVLARRLDVDERALVVTCLHATRAGLLSLTWDLICPHCRGVRQSPTDLRDVPERAHCDVCDVEFGTDGDNAVEVSFHVHPSIRAVPPVFYCSAEPAQKRHIHLQQRLGPSEKRTLSTSLEPGRWRARVSGASAPQWIDVAAGGPAHAVWRATGGSNGSNIAAGTSATLELVNDIADEVTFVVEDARWADDALRPGDLFVLPAFRDLFSEQSLGLGVRVSVGEQTILFTDMVGSTWFYENRGDAEAFAEVRRHFAEVFAEIDTGNGCVVKTVGDAVMAAFPNPIDALRAARAILRRFPEDRSDTRVRLRISVCRGPCIAVSLASGVDFFGRTVNLAAKLQALAAGNEVAFPRALLAHPGVEQLLDEGGSVEALTLEHSAYPEPIPAVKWRIR